MNLKMKTDCIKRDLMKEYKIYVKQMVIVQIVICIVVLSVLVLFSNEAMVKNGNILKKLAVEKADKKMRETIDNTITSINLKRESAINRTQELIELAADIFHSLPDNNAFEKIDIIYNKFANLEYGKVINFLLINKNTNTIDFSSNEELISSGDIMDENQIEEINIKCKLYREVANDEHTLIIFADEGKVDEIVKKQVYEEIHKMIYSENEYIWVHEIINYEGGDNYARRVIHPNLKEEEGTYLSTLTEDIGGNYPYAKELEGIKKNGELFQEYYFKNKVNEEITLKRSYAKIYKPFNWIIAMGNPVEDINAYTDKVMKQYDKAFYIRIIMSTLIIGIMFGLGIQLIYKIQKRYHIQVSEYIKSETEVDFLTGAFTRKAAEEYLKKEIEHFPFIKEPTLVIMLDLDDFKQVNDTYGHDVGDLVLKKVTEEISGCTRSHDKLFRWGGEEFLLVCRGVSGKAHRDFAKKIIDSVRKIKFETNEGSFSVTISMGGAFLTECDTKPDGVVKRADRALYFAKNGGKNKYCYNEKLKGEDDIEDLL